MRNCTLCAAFGGLLLTEQILLVSCWQTTRSFARRNGVHPQPSVQRTFLYSTATPSSGGSESVTDSWTASNGAAKSSTAANLDEDLSMPWSEVQDWALRDNLPKYTVVIPLDETVQNSPDSASPVYALWRTMLKDVPELGGYPIDYLQRVHSNQLAKNQSSLQVTPGLLPFLEDYEFTAGGGIAGKIYGVPGLAYGTRIETSAVSNIEVTLPQGFVRTTDGSAAYELGKPQREAFGDLSGESLVRGSVTAVQGGSYELLKTVQEASSSQSGGSVSATEADGMLVRLGATTGILLAGATAINMLSHHLTVNVFWV